MEIPMSLDLDRGSLQRTIRDTVPSVQRAFDVYQSSHFIGRPSEFFCLELCGEAGELANLEKKRWRGSSVDEAAVADEAADVFIALMNFCNARDIDLGDAVAQKLERIKPHHLP
jgi:NTP pyrophosphatase (non-canonical NTP hydrolase)